MSVATEDSGSHRLQLTYNLVGIALVLLLGGVGVGYALSGSSSGERAEPNFDDGGPVVERTILGRDLSIPASWLRYGAEGSSGFASQVDVVLPLPLAADGSIVEVDVSLVPKSRARPSAALVDGVYLHQFKDEQLKGPVGLVGKPLGNSEGYEGETVWYDALSADPFVAKCAAPVDSNGQSRCLRTVILPSGLAAIYAFDATALAGWRTFDAEVTPWLRRIGAL